MNYRNSIQQIDKLKTEYEVLRSQKPELIGSCNF